MKNKFTKNLPTSQSLPSGVALNDHNIEFVGVKPTKSVIWLQCGNSHSFDNLPTTIYIALRDLLSTDIAAVKYLSDNYPEHLDNLPRLVELYTYYMYGDLDYTPDVIDGVLQPCENFRDTSDCPSLNFTNKYIDIDGVHLSKRDLVIIDDCIAGLPDKMIAHKLNIAHSTFDFHKRNLLKKIGADSKTDLIVKSFNNKVVCAQ